MGLAGFRRPLFFVMNLQSKSLLAPVQDVRRDEDKKHNGDDAIQREECSVEAAKISGCNDEVLIHEKGHAYDHA